MQAYFSRSVNFELFYFDVLYIYSDSSRIDAFWF